MKKVAIKLEDTEHLGHLTIKEVFAMVERGEVGTPVEEDKKPVFKVIDGGLK